MKRLVLVLMAALATGCGHEPAAPTPPPTDTNVLVTPIEHTGPVQIDFVSATEAPGSTIAGCGPMIDGCRGRLRITVRLRPQFDGPVLFSRAYLHAMNLQACLWGETGAMTLQAGVPTLLEIPLDRADRCGVPLDAVTMDVVVGGPTQIESRQAWTIHYHFVP